MKRVLIIEDDGDTLELLSFIASSSNYEVIPSSRVLPLEEVERLNPDMILLDHWLGKKLGGDLCNEVKQNPHTKDIPIIMISAIQGLGQIAYDNKADGCLEKPFDIEEIEAVLDAYLF